MAPVSPTRIILGRSSLPSVPRGPPAAAHKVSVHGIDGPERLRPADPQQAADARRGQGDVRALAGGGQGRAPATWPASPRWMVAQQYVTEYQAALLARGHADGFFLNEYKILDRLGQGRMAGVYKAHAPARPGRRHQGAAAVQGQGRRPARPASSARPGWPCKLKHPNVVRTFQVGEAGGLHYLVMEYLEGETLEDVLPRRKQAAAARGGAAGLPGAAGLAAHPRAGAGPPRPEAGQPDARARPGAGEPDTHAAAARSRSSTSAWAAPCSTRTAGDAAGPAA